MSFAARGGSIELHRKMNYRAFPFTGASVFTSLFPAAMLFPALISPVSGSTPTAVAPVPATSAPATWNIDKTHSELSFQIRHFVSRVRGTFKEWKGTIVADPEAWENASIDVEIATTSIYTDNERRDSHLRTSDFFLADSFPTIRFKSSRIARSGDDAKIHGDLTIRGVTKPVVLDGSFTGMLKSAQGDRIGFEASTTLNRLDYGVKWNRAAEGGGVMLGDEVKISLVIAAVRVES
ncbi:MAG: YceI family protein [Gemmatimonadota bacterium]|nr:YceI family protein [Gemmatimonadota bacterium]